jgi:two-component system CheB/CheR fusion protein
VDLAVLALKQPQVLRGTLLLVFHDVPSPPPRRGRRAGATDRSTEALEQEAAQLRETLQNTREAMQTSQEELQSSNEELQSTNEELQSTNEELTTSKEEMQSLNEELQTVNTELQSKVDDLSRVNDDMKNLLDSTEIAALFLDDGLRVRRFTSRASELIKLIPSDVGRPVTDIASKVLYPELSADVAEVLRNLVFIEKAIPGDAGRWFNVRIMPYRTLDNRIDGVVVTLVDCTQTKHLEAELAAAREELGRLRGGQGEASGGGGTG